MSATSFLDGRIELYHGDCLRVLRKMPDNSVDSAVVDPPYHLHSITKRFAKTGRTESTATKSGPHQRTATGFMGKKWDGGDIAFRPAVWKQVFRVLKPGGYLIAFASSRGYGRMQVAIEKAGFDTHPMFAWIFGSGFPKATRIDAEGYDGFRYGKQSAKPAMEPIYMGQKPFSEKNGTLNILKWGTGAVNIDGCRVHADDAQGGEYTITRWKPGATLNQTGGTWKPEEGGVDYHGELQPGRWPANVIHDGSEEVLAAFPDSAGQQGDLNGHSKDRLSQGIYGDMKAARDAPARGDSGSAARFFYSAKADAEDRLGSKHPTIKPLDLIQYLVRFVTPPRGTVLDCFAGTGTTGEAAWRENMRAILIEKDADSIADIKRRIDLMQKPAKRAAVAKTKNNLQGAEGTPLFDKVSHPLPTRAESSAGDAAPPEPFPARTNSEAA